MDHRMGHSGRDLDASFYVGLHLQDRLCPGPKGFSSRMLCIRYAEAGGLGGWGNAGLTEIFHYVCPATEKYRAGVTVRLLALATDLLYLQYRGQR